MSSTPNQIMPPTLRGSQERHCATKLKLGNMAGCLPKERESSGSRGGNTLIEYKYVNYDLDKVKADSELVVDELAKAQTALDVVNNSVTFEVEID